jgi:hypothetical protein
MFTMLLANAEGRAYLTDSKLLKEIALNLEALDPVKPFWRLIADDVAYEKSTFRTTLFKTGHGRYDDIRLLRHARDPLRP